MITKKLSLLVLILFAAIQAFSATIYSLYSPDKQIRIEFSTDSIQINNVIYRVFYKDKPFILNSQLGLQIAGQPSFTSFFVVGSTKTRENRSSWKPLYGEKAVYPDNYNELEVSLDETVPPNRHLKIVFRAYNEGIAFRYELPEQAQNKEFSITRELTEYAFADSTKAWEEYGHEGLYSKVLPGNIKLNCELPFTFETPDGFYGALAEGGASDYPRAYLQTTASARNQRNFRNSVSIMLRGEAKGKGPYATTWRMVTISDRPGGLMENNYLLLNLNRPSQGDFSWVKPGTAIRDNTVSTAGSKRFIDYSAKMGIDYVILDWGWYGPPNGENTDPSFVNVVNPGTGRPIPNHTGLDLPEVISYGKSKGVGIFLYVNRQGLERYMDKIFPVYESWGIKGIKPGFVNVGNQEWQMWTEELVRKAAEHKLMVNIHDAYRPTGMSRTYPNLVGQEGIHGNEQSPDADHTTKLPFTRFTIGAADYTPGYCRISLKNTWTHKLALAVLFYNPAQFLFWGEPLTDECHNRPELAFWKDIPTTWDDTKVLSGAIGEYAVVARKKGNDWYVGGITNKSERSMQLAFDFLTPGKNYEATIYTDTPGSPAVSITTKKINQKDKMDFPLLASGGFALLLKEK